MWQQLAWVAGTILAWELVRWWTRRALEERWQRSIGAFLRRHGVKLEQFRFIDRLWVRQVLLEDPELERLAAESARARGEPMGVVRHRVEDWVDEIVPYFNLFSYYKLGAAVARRAVRLGYELWFDAEALERAMAALPPGAIVVYVANHRSNADYVVLSVGALRQVALSYAVGEWALVWPIDRLFRSFGSYFVRRGEKDPLYHAVLERYLQLVASRGLTTAFFLEGGLSRDGALREPKVGLLDYLVGVPRQEPEREIVFIPVGINYDRVLEDRTLLGATGPPDLGARLLSLARVLARLPVLVLATFARAALRSHRKYGYAAVSFGAPIPLRALAEDPVRLVHLEREPRRIAVARVADRLLERVAAVIPATPVVLIARALGAGHRELVDLRRAVREDIAALRASGRPLAFGVAFTSVRRARARAREDDGAKFDLDQDLLASEEAERAVDLALVLLRRRRLVRTFEGRAEPEPGAGPILAYYARSLDPPARLAERGAPSPAGG